MRKIFIDITRLIGRGLKGRLPTGIDRVSLEYVRYFSDEARGVMRLGGRTVLLSRAASAGMFAELLRPSPRFRRTTLQVIARAHLTPQNNGEFKDAVLFNTGHSGLEHHGYARQLRKLQVKPIVLVHDLIPITHPEYCRPGEQKRHVARMNNALDLANGIITNSATTLDDLKSYARKVGRPMPSAAAALLAPAALPAPSLVRPVAAPYFVMLSTIEPRKNHWMILQVWDKLVERYGKHAPNLVLVGQRGWECENIADLLERRESLRGVVTELSACSDADLATFLRHSQALLFPSFVEGYGMPLAEALALGTPVIASNLPVFREIAGDIPVYLDPLDGVGWMAQIEVYAGPVSPQRQSQLERAKHFTAPSWSAHFTKVESLLERVT